MGGRFFFTVILCAVATVAAYGDDAAPVVEMRQPLGLASHCSDCADSASGVECVCLTLSDGEANSESGVCSSEDCTTGGCSSESCSAGGCSKTACLHTACGKTKCLDPADWRCADLCCRQGFWIRADYLMWWVADDDLPALVTSSPLGTPINDVGVLGLGTTNTEFGGPLAGGFRSGSRISFGYSNGACGCGLEGSLWGLENARENGVWSSTGDPSFARPFTNVDPLVNGPDAELVSFPGVLDGTVRVRSSSDLYSGNLGLRCNLLCCSDACDASSTRFDLITGYRFFRIREGLEITESLVSTAVAGPCRPGYAIRHLRPVPHHERVPRRRVRNERCHSARSLDRRDR